eukprot:CAMPEP_0118943602 /NCGR_PEP_ID=MMETSP1169-20130426/38669_1 /TAXON_ID=36882 /ORGANISM="Pyramimonas obovata, Strain CCMP722" /LENGTH=51 /DNA_ID=CAMNT_0006888897 /DNA_START=188 /DNA_END=343 /DNA_ORIENTATION=+
MSNLVASSRPIILSELGGGAAGLTMFNTRSMRSLPAHFMSLSVTVLPGVCL